MALTGMHDTEDTSKLEELLQHSPLVDSQGEPGLGDTELTVFELVHENNPRINTIVAAEENSPAAQAPLADLEPLLPSDSTATGDEGGLYSPQRTSRVSSSFGPVRTEGGAATPTLEADGAGVVVVEGRVAGATMTTTTMKEDEKDEAKCLDNESREVVLQWLQEPAHVSATGHDDIGDGDTAADEESPHSPLVATRSSGPPSLRTDPGLVVGRDGKGGPSGGGTLLRQPTGTTLDMAAAEAVAREPDAGAGGRLRPKSREYFATAGEQEFQCLCRIGSLTLEERREKKKMARLLSFGFASGPLPCLDGACCCGGFACRPPCVFSCCGQRFRSCSRAGNFTVLLERLVGVTREPGGEEPYEEEEEEEEKEEEKGNAEADALELGDFAAQRATHRRDVWLVVGPYWPFCLTVTASPSAAVPALVCMALWRTLPLAVLAAYLLLAAATLAALASVSCRNPGLVPYYSQEPAASAAHPADERPSRKWIYNDRTKSWRPRGAVYDRDVNAVILGFDHVCPFTGTAIGARNLKAFYAFVGLVQALIWSSIGLALYALYALVTDTYTPPF